LDFVGHHRQEFRFDRRLRALFGGTRKELTEHVEQGFPYLPAGCHMELDPIARDVVLRSIRSAIPSRWAQKVDELRALVAAGHEPTLGRYLEHTGLDLDDVYSGDLSWSDLSHAAGLALAPSGPAEGVLRRAVGRLLHVDDALRLGTYQAMLSSEASPDVASLDERHRRLARMLVASLVNQVPEDQLPADSDLTRGLAFLWQHPQIRRELLELCEVLAGRYDHVARPLPRHADCPVYIHARYSRIEMLAAFGIGTGARAPQWREGVKWVAPVQTDLATITLDKTSKGFSPTTRYRDYAISPTLFHWESQSTTSADSATGRRYQGHDQRESEMVLFARLDNSERAFWCLGPASYVRHEGERPMAITWKLAVPLPGDLFQQFAAAVA
jgi:hypothetical protein